jgi:hypothetical protein
MDRPEARGTGQIRGKVKDENGIGIANARSLSSEAGEGAGVAKEIGEDPESRNFSAKENVAGARQKTTRQRYIPCRQIG